MPEIIDVDPKEVREWLKDHPDWEFRGKVIQKSHEEVLKFVNEIYKAGSELIIITDYVWEIEPVYEGDEFNPDSLKIKLPAKVSERQIIFEIINRRQSEFVGLSPYKDKGSDWLWYFFEPEPQKIVVGNKELTWYS